MIKQLEINGLKSYDNFGLMIATRKISQPKKKIIKESIPFSNVVYDFSNINGEIYWEERTLEYSFDIAEFTTEEMEIIKSDVLEWLLNVHDADIYDPYIGDYHFHGSFDSDSWEEDFGAGVLNVSFTVYPYKISNVDTKKTESFGVSDDGYFEGNYSVAGLKIDGKSVQDGTPTPDSPVEIKSIGDGENLDIISCAKNLLNTKGGFSYGSYYADGTIANNTTNVIFTQKIHVEVGQTYTLSANTSITTLGIGYFNGETWIDRNYVNHVDSYTFSIPSNATKIKVYINYDNSTSMTQSLIDSLNVQLERGPIATSYEAYKENVSTIALNEPLRSLNDIYDTYENGIITRRVGCVVFDGSENWAGWTLSNGKKRFNIDIPNAKVKHVPLFSHLKGGFVNEYGYGFIGDKAEVCLQFDGTLDEFKAWLSENNLTLVYELATPTIETVDLPKITSHSPTTNIIIDDNVSTTFEVYYNESKTLSIYNYSSHRISPTIEVEGNINITINNTTYSIANGVYNDVLYLESGENTLKLVGYGTIRISFKGERF